MLFVDSLSRFLVYSSDCRTVPKGSFQLTRRPWRISQWKLEVVMDVWNVKNDGKQKIIQKFPIKEKLLVVIDN